MAVANFLLIMNLFLGVNWKVW